MLVPILLLSAFSAIWMWRIFRRPLDFPPGPPGIFSLLSLRQANEPLMVRVMVKLSEQYGPVVGLFMVNKPFVCVTGYEAVRDVMLNPDLMGRPNSFVFRLRTKNLRTGILATDGELWKEERRFMIRHLRDFGFGKSSTEGMMVDQVRDLLADLELVVQSSNDGHVSLENLFTVSFVNIFWALVAGERIMKGDPQMEKILSAVTGFLRVTSITSVITHFPFLRFIAPEWTGYNQIVKHINMFRTYIENVVEEHRRAKRVADEERDLIDVYLNKLDINRNNAESNFTGLEEQMMGTIMDLFTAGIETTSNLLGFALIYMILNPDVQTKVQEEIDSILHGNFPSLTDFGSLPYTEATLMEIQRLGVVAPITVPHVAMKNTTCQGYNIPKETTIFVNLWSVFMDPTLWPDPLQFRPERHLDSHGKVLKSEYLVTFGLGKRICLGESVAKSATFLFFVSMMQRFRFSMPTDILEPNLIPSPEPIPGLTFGPKPCIARISQRRTL